MWESVTADSHKFLIWVIENRESKVQKIKVSSDTVVVDSLWNSRIASDGGGDVSISARMKADSEFGEFDSDCLIGSCAVCKQVNEFKHGFAGISLEGGVNRQLHKISESLG
jgi:hypothetical protein